MQQIVDPCNKRSNGLEDPIKQIRKEDNPLHIIKPKLGIMVILIVIATHAMKLAIRLLNAGCMQSGVE